MNIRVLTALMALSLVGLIAFQLYWAERLISTNKGMFNRDAEHALYVAIKKLEEKVALSAMTTPYNTHFKVNSARYEQVENTRGRHSAIDSLPKSPLRERGIDLVFELDLYDPVPHTFTPSHVSGEEMTSYRLKARWSPNDSTDKSGCFFLPFPRQPTDWTNQVKLTLSASMIFLLIILICFPYAIYTIYKQKKRLDLKYDFINNMAHEFKTPISTVSLACQAMQEDAVGASTILKYRYLGIIQEENKRLGMQVDKVLEMSDITRKDFELKLEHVNIHEVIEKAISTIHIQIAKKEGVISKSLDASHPVVRADHTHVTNIVYNLLDNANKYAKQSPDLQITTQDTAKGVLIKFIDRGIGMPKKAVKRIFEKFYRIPTGNRRDAKGFGLGLFYVKSMIEAHRGSIRVSTKLGKGSEFAVYLPHEPKK